MNICDFMTSHVTVISPDASVQEAAIKMKEEDIGFLPVCDGERLLGTATDRDLVIGALATNRDLENMQIKDVMNKDVIYIFEDQSEEDAARLMKEKKIRRLLVLSRDKKLTGVVSLGDLSTQANDQNLGGSVLQQVSA